MSSRKHIRHRLLLDEGVHLPQSYPELNNLHDVIHVSQVDLKGKTDELRHERNKLTLEITKLSKEKKDILVTRQKNSIL